MENKSTTKEDGSSTRIDLVEGYFNTHADYWSEAYNRPERINDMVLVDRKNIAMNYVTQNVKQGGRILDAGCGAGLATLALLQAGYKVDAYDIAPKMLTLCEENLKAAGMKKSSYSIQKGDVLLADVEPGTYDAIVALGFIQYQSDEVESLKKMGQMLKPGGFLVLSGPVKMKLTEYFGLSKLYYGLRNRIKNTAPHPESAILNKISTHFYGVGRFKKLMAESGFRFLQYQGHGFINFAILRDFTARGGSFLYRFFAKLSKVLPIGRFGNDMVALAKKEER